MAAAHELFSKPIDAKVLTRLMAIRADPKSKEGEAGEGRDEVGRCRLTPGFRS